MIRTNAEAGNTGTRARLFRSGPNLITSQDFEQEGKRTMFRTTSNLNSQVVNKLPICHFCLDEAAYDAKTVYGYRASMCSRDFKKVGVDSEALRLIIIEPAPAVTTKERRFAFGTGAFAPAPNFA